MAALSAVTNSSAAFTMPQAPTRITYWNNNTGVGVAALVPYLSAGLIINASDSSFASAVVLNSSFAFGGAADPLSASNLDVSVRQFFNFCTVLFPIHFVRADAMVSFHSAKIARRA
jgi:hypothetical protein